MLKGCPISGARGVDSREIVIAKLPQIVEKIYKNLFYIKNFEIELDRCDISPIARRSAELLFLSRFTMPPIEEQHKNTIERLKAI